MKTKEKNQKPMLNGNRTIEEWSLENKMSVRAARLIAGRHAIQIAEFGESEQIDATKMDRAYAEEIERQTTKDAKRSKTTKELYFVRRTLEKYAIDQFKAKDEANKDSKGTILDPEYKKVFKNAARQNLFEQYKDSIESQKDPQFPGGEGKENGEKMKVKFT
jgi:membrane peptidoglycan carboxypeptidase